MPAATSRPTSAKVIIVVFRRGPIVRSPVELESVVKPVGTPVPVRRARASGSVCATATATGGPEAARGWPLI